MQIQIKHRFTDATLFEGDYVSLYEAIAAAVKSGANLSGADLSRANLSRANLSGANLSGADLSRADLSRADLSRADLSRADLSRANLYGADLSRANLSGANLSGADLSRADLSRANLSRANLSGANLSGADLSRANLSRANLSRANLSGANLSGAKNLNSHDSHKLAIARTRHLPEGDLIGWKKLCDYRIAKLLIPAKAKRSHAFGRKCRCSYAKVLAIFDGKKSVKEGYSLHDSNFVYKTGCVVRPSEPFDLNWQEECASGIHFYITREEAEAHS